jgi:hypothetical protein
MNTNDIGLVIDEKEKQLQVIINSQAEVEQAILLLSKSIIELQGKKKDLEYSKSKANQNRQVLSSELRVLRNQFFASKI